MSAEFAVERIRWLHKRIKDGYFPNAKRLAERFSISQRQAQRDVDYLRTELGAPLEFCRIRKGYRYAEAFELSSSIEQGDSDDYVDLFAAAEDTGLGMHLLSGNFSVFYLIRISLLPCA